MGLINLLTDSVKEITYSISNIYDNFQNTYKTLEQNINIVKKDFGKLYNTNSTTQKFKLITTITDDIDKLVNDFTTGLEFITNDLYTNYKPIIKGHHFSNGKRTWFWKDRVDVLKKEITKGNIGEQDYANIKQELLNNNYLNRKKPDFLKNTIKELDSLINY